jgi:hypothetical protein
LYIAWNTAKIGFGASLLVLSLIGIERVSRWALQQVQGSIDYWKERLVDHKNGGNESPQLVAVDTDEFFDESDGWKSPIIEKRNNTLTWSTQF